MRARQALELLKSLKPGDDLNGIIFESFRDEDPYPAFEGTCKVCKNKRWFVGKISRAKISRFDKGCAIACSKSCGSIFGNAGKPKKAPANMKTKKEYRKIESLIPEKKETKRELLRESILEFYMNATDEDRAFLRKLYK